MRHNATAGIYCRGIASKESNYGNRMTLAVAGFEPGTHALLMKLEERSAFIR